MRPDCDVLILGGGCAGLSLAAALGRYAPELNVQILEERQAYGRDRTWCFWNTEPHLFESCISHTWSDWRVSSGTATVRAGGGRYVYQHLPADGFYAEALRLVTNAPRQKLALNTAVQGVMSLPEGGRAETNRGTLTARWIFDSRPHRESESLGAAEREVPGQGRSGLLQRFLGWHIRCDRPCFDPGVAGLMDFVLDGQPGRTLFFYTLPFSRTEALVEATYLDSPALPPADAGAALTRRLAEVTGGSGYQIVFREAGCLPMTAAESRDSHGQRNTHVVPIGVRGGRAKPSSGYAFLRIQRQSRMLAQALGRGAPLPSQFEAVRFRTLDGIFLEALKRRPEAVPEYFLKLFQAVPADRLVRFLSETASWTECLRVAAALPKLPFLGAALASTPRLLEGAGV